MNDYLLVDIRQTVKVKKIYPNTWHINPNEGYNIFEVKSLDKNGFEIEFTIHVNENHINENYAKNNGSDPNNCDDIKCLDNKLLSISTSLFILVTIIFVLCLINLFLLYVIFRK